MKTPWFKKALGLIMVLGISIGIWTWNLQISSNETKTDPALVVNKSDQSLIKANRGPAAAESSATTSESGQRSRFQWSPQTKVAIEEFANISEKVFASPEEQMRRSELLMNPEYVQNIGEYLLKVPSEEVQDQIHDQSLEFLVESLKLGSNEALTQIEKVIADPQVENLKLPLEQRKFLGETKGELLYQYAAFNSVDNNNGSSSGSNTERQIAGLIPGPATQKIWNQVLRELEANFAESKRELAETR